MPKRANIYILYDPKDYRFLKPLETQLNILKRQGLIDTWSKNNLVAGSDVAQVTQQKLRASDLVVALARSPYTSPTL